MRYAPAVKKVGAMIRVVICIKNASWLYGHCEDQARAAQPRVSAVVHYVALAGFRAGFRGKIANNLLRAPIANIYDVHCLFLTD